MNLINSHHMSILATVRKSDALIRSQLKDFGQYVAECLPKYVQKIQLTAGDELEVLAVPEGIIPVLQFLKDHHNAQFASLVDIAGMDVPSRPYRFEVSNFAYNLLGSKQSARFFRLYTICYLFASTHASESKHTLMN